MITQMRFNHGSETRKQPNIEKADFQTLLEYERQKAKLTDKLHARLRPAVAAKVRHWSERYIGHPALAITPLFAVVELFEVSLHLTSLLCHLDSQETRQYR
jgi:hypothetical protein